MNWVKRKGQPAVNLDFVASICTRLKESGSPEALVVFQLPNGGETVWEVDNIDVASAIELKLMVLINPHSMSISDSDEPLPSQE